jgi:hypothetical protein
MTLIRLELSMPGSWSVVGDFSGAATSLGGLDFRPRDGKLYGVSSSGGQVVMIDTMTAATTLVSTLSTAPASNDFGIDFNPQVVISNVLNDRLRIVEANSQQNLRVNADNGATLVDGMLTYAMGDPNAGMVPAVNEVAYLNSDNDITTPTQLYYLDFGLDILATTTAPNAGILTTIGSLGVDFDNYTGFDILTPYMGTNLAYALLRVNGQSGLYSINLKTGAATALGSISATDAYGLAIQPVPEPGLIALLAACGVPATLLVLRRRRK